MVNEIAHSLFQASLLPLGFGIPKANSYPIEIPDSLSHFAKAVAAKRTGIQQNIKVLPFCTLALTDKQSA